ncbi:MAG: hypothetical protein ACK4UO_11435 [Pseudolabrys sp.]
MRTPVRSRRLLALLAAYVVVLQALLLPLSVAAGALTGDEICSAAAADSGRQSGSHDGACACAAGCGMQCCAQALGTPPAAQTVPIANEAGILASPAGLDIPRPLADDGGYAARAPPAA